MQQGSAAPCECLQRHIMPYIACYFVIDASLSPDRRCASTCRGRRWPLCSPAAGRASCRATWCSCCRPATRNTSTCCARWCVGLCVFRDPRFTLVCQLNLSGHRQRLSQLACLHPALLAADVHHVRAEKMPEHGWQWVATSGIGQKQHVRCVGYKVMLPRLFALVRTSFCGACQVRGQDARGGGAAAPGPPGGG